MTDPTPTRPGGARRRAAAEVAAMSEEAKDELAALVLEAVKRVRELVGRQPAAPAELERTAIRVPEDCWEAVFTAAPDLPEHVFPIAGGRANLRLVQ